MPPLTQPGISPAGGLGSFGTGLPPLDPNLVFNTKMKQVGTALQETLPNLETDQFQDIIGSTDPLAKNDLASLVNYKTSGIGGDDLEKEICNKIADEITSNRKIKSLPVNKKKSAVAYAIHKLRVAKGLANEYSTNPAGKNKADLVEGMVAEQLLPHLAQSWSEWLSEGVSGIADAAVNAMNYVGSQVASFGQTVLDAANGVLNMLGRSTSAEGSESRFRRTAGCSDEMAGILEDRRSNLSPALRDFVTTNFNNIASSSSDDGARVLIEAYNTQLDEAVATGLDRALADSLRLNPSCLEPVLELTTPSEGGTTATVTTYDPSSGSGSGSALGGATAAPEASPDISQGTPGQAVGGSPTPSTAVGGSPTASTLTITTTIFPETPSRATAGTSPATPRPGSSPATPRPGLSPAPSPGTIQGTPSPSPGTPGQGTPGQGTPGQAPRTGIATSFTIGDNTTTIYSTPRATTFNINGTDYGVDNETNGGLIGAICAVVGFAFATTVALVVRHHRRKSKEAGVRTADTNQMNTKKKPADFESGNAANGMVANHPRLIEIVEHRHGEESLADARPVSRVAEVSVDDAAAGGGSPKPDFEEAGFTNRGGVFGVASVRRDNNPVFGLDSTGADADAPAKYDTLRMDHVEPIEEADDLAGAVLYENVQPTKLTQGHNVEIQKFGDSYCILKEGTSGLKVGQVVTQVGEMPLSSDTFDVCVAELKKNSPLTIQTSVINIRSDEFWKAQYTKLNEESKEKFGGDVGVNFNGQEPHQIPRNRHTNIFPPKATNVALQVEGIGNTYVHANSVDGANAIATIGPVTAGFHAFWAMVLQNDIDSISMVTDYIEGSKLKCNEYFNRTSVNAVTTFPASNGLPEITVTYKSYEETDTHELKKLELVSGGVTREITHLKFNEWPDHGVPESTNSLIKYSLESIDKKEVVHCSAGVGRTGVKLATRMALKQFQENPDEFKAKDSLNQAKELVSYLKECRGPHCVQAWKQFKFIYQVLEDIKSYDNFEHLKRAMT